MGETIEIVGYDELCVPGDIDRLALATEDTIVHVAPARTHHPSAPVDYGGILGSQPQVPKRLSGNANHPEAWWTTPFQSPAQYAALLGDALCYGGLPDDGRHDSVHLLLARDRLIVADSYFVRSTIRSLPEDLIQRIAASGPEHRADVPTRPGLHYFAGAAWSHFGHFVLEGLARWWLLERLPGSVQAELRFVFYNDRPLAPWQLEFLDALGVTAERVVHLAEPQRFERMIVPSLAYNLHRWAASVQDTMWERIGRAFDRGDGPARVYLSRSRHAPNRTLLEEAEIERRFQARGFTVLHPQELSIADQVAAIRHARLVAGSAGSAGSAMYLSAFTRRGARKLVISPRNLTFRDDQIIAHLRGGQLAYFLCAAGDPDVNPRKADYHVGLRHLDTAIDRWIAADDSDEREHKHPVPC
jgi:capsular polysaccharide biosynthesis protein